MSTKLNVCVHRHAYPVTTNGMCFICGNELFERICELGWDGIYRFQNNPVQLITFSGAPPKGAKIINLTPHDINIVGVTDMDRESSALRHIFADDPSGLKGNSPCIRCGTWRDEACDIPCTFTIPRSGSLARVEEENEVVGSVNGVPILCKTFGKIVGLPDPQENTYFIVSLIVAQAVAKKFGSSVWEGDAREGRPDVLVVGESVRDGGGQIIGARSLAVI